MKLDFCALCGATDSAALEHHHYKPKALGGDDDDRNLLTLCGECHGMVHDIPRPMRLGALIIAGREKAKERSAPEWHAIAHQSTQRAERAVEAAEAARAADMRRAAAERAAIRRTEPIKCQACPNMIAPAPTGRRKRFCSDACRMRTHRRFVTPETARKEPVQPGDLIAPCAFPAKNGSFVTSNINDLAEPQNRASAPAPRAWTPASASRGIVGPAYVIRAAVINARVWEEVVSSDGVVSYVSRIGQRALQSET
jgi:HNH endonuclease